jgi:outer membrane biosynthesis protein TonB
MDLQDAHLARALDELARLANVAEPQPVVNSAEQGEDAEEEAENEIPQLIPEPIPIEVPIPPTPISVQSPYREEDDAEPLPTGAPESAAVVPDREHSLLAELESLTPPAAPDGKQALAAPKFESRSLSPRRALPRVALIAIAFIGGMMFERFVKILESVRPSSQATVSETTAAAPEGSKQVTGRITYKSADGSSQPDRGARIIALPQQREGEVKLSVVGFRPADSEVDAKVAAATLKALGGAVATANEAGLYQLDTPAGNYQLLVLSHFQSRGDKEPVDQTIVKLLSAYFDKPNDLLGRVKYHFGPLKVKGTGDVWDHSF